MTTDTVGARIAEARVRAGLSQAKLARLIGVNDITVSRWELGSRNPRHTSLIALAAALNVDVRDLAGEAAA